MKARGNTKTILTKVEKIQSLVGEAKGLHDDDRNSSSREKAQKNLEEAFELCLEITSMYDPIL